MDILSNIRIYRDYSNELKIHVSLVRFRPEPLLFLLNLRHTLQYKHPPIFTTNLLPVIEGGGNRPPTFTTNFTTNNCIGIC